MNGVEVTAADTAAHTAEGPQYHDNDTAIYWPTFTPPHWPGFAPPLTGTHSHRWLQKP
jgi:hypothetical protein